MTSTFQRIANNLRRPLPDLAGYLAAKVMSALWKRALHRAGPRFHVGRGAQIQGAASISIGDGFVAGQMLWIEAVRRYRDYSYAPVIEIGSHVVCSQNVHIAATQRVTIGNGVLIGSRVHITDHGHGRYVGAEQDSPAIPPAERRLSDGNPVAIEENVWLGDGVVVLPGVTIGQGSIVGANSVVSRSIPPHVIAVGAPAVPIKSFDLASGLWKPIAP